MRKQPTRLIARHPRHLFLILAILFPFCVPAAVPSQSGISRKSNRLERIESLGLRSISGRLPTFYSPHTRARARYLQGLLGGEVAYYADQFHLGFDSVTLAVLDAAQWPQVAGDEPFGMPSVEGTMPAVVVMPASWDKVTWMVLPKREQVPPAMLHRALANGNTWNQVKFAGCDGIGTHEIGHFIIRQLAIDPQTHWFSEFLASYVGYAYLKAKEPGQALSNEIFWTVGLENSPHEFTKLDDFESKYEELQRKYPGNYGWYQLALDQRVIQVFEESGLDYLWWIRKEFPTGSPTLDSARLLEKLEVISPGWKAWALRLEAGKVTAESASTAGETHAH